MPIAIDKPSKYFNTVTYAGAGTTTQAVTGVGFSPDFIWIKNRSDAYSHVLQDICRGFGATKNLASNSPNNQGASGATGDNYGHVSTSDSDGFTVTHTINGSNDGGTIRKGTHYSGDNYVGWCWDANGAGVSNTSGSITSTVSANTTSGFSIVKWTGTGATGTIGHGLGIAPKLLILKDTSNVYNWYVYTSATGSNIRFEGLNTTSASASTPSEFTTTSTLITNVTSTASQNTSGANMLLYCFAEVKGFSKIGSYTGNGSADGVFIYTGFKPAWVMTRQTNGANSWHIHDNKRNLFNVVNTQLKAESSGADETPAGGENSRDFLSNGFKFRNADHNNQSGQTYIYMAFAENPFVSSKGIPCTAR